MDVESTADRFVGIDLSKARLDVHVRPDGTAFGCATDPEGLGALVARLQPLSPCLVVLEASGGYESVVAAALAEAGLPVAIVNPRQVRKFAGAIGQIGQDRRDRCGGDCALRPSRAAHGTATAR
jgi:transposase